MVTNADSVERIGNEHRFIELYTKGEDWLYKDKRYGLNVRGQFIEMYSPHTIPRGIYKNGKGISKDLACGAFVGSHAGLTPIGAAAFGCRLATIGRDPGFGRRYVEEAKSYTMEYVEDKVCIVPRRIYHLISKMKIGLWAKWVAIAEAYNIVERVEHYNYYLLNGQGMYKDDDWTPTLGGLNTPHGICKGDEYAISQSKHNA